MTHAPSNRPEAESDRPTPAIESAVASNMTNTIDAQLHEYRKQTRRTEIFR